MRKCGVAVLAAILGLSAAAQADSFKTKSIAYEEAIVEDIKDGQFIASISGRDQEFKLSDVTLISIDKQTDFNKAETLREKPVEAARAYKDVIAKQSNKAYKRVAEARAIPIFDAQGMYADAINAFLDLYSTSPTDGTWALRPKNLPASATSSYLKDAAAAIAAKIEGAPFSKEVEAQKNLRGLLLEIYNRQGKTAEASKLAKDLGVESASAAPTAAAQAESVAVAAPVTGAGAADVDAALAASKWAQAIALADSALSSARDEVTTIHLYNAKAQAYAQLSKLEDAAAAYLRIPAYYPNNAGAASEALFAAADIQVKLGHKDEAKRLGREIQEKYSRTPAAEKARRAGLTG